MEINKNKLQEALAIVRPGLAKKEKNIEQSTSFAFIKGRVVTFNDEISLSHPIPELDIEGAVETDRLYQLLSKIKAETISLEQQKNQIIVSSGRSKAGLILQKEIKLPLDEEIKEKGKWSTLPKEFNHFLNFCIPSCSKKMTMPILRCIHIDPEGIIESSDGHRITHCDLKEKIKVKDFLLPGENASHVVRLQPIKIADGNRGWIHFKNSEGTILSCRIQKEDFVDTTPHLHIKGERIIFPKSLPAILERAMIFSLNEELNQDNVSIILANKKLTVKAETTLGWFKESVSCKYNKEEITFNITPYLLRDIIKETRTGSLSDKTLTFQGEGWIYMTTLRV